MNRLPFEVILQVFDYLPLSAFRQLYQVFPQHIMDEALLYRLRNTKDIPMIHLVSTNSHELASNNINKKNESYISLYYTSFDPIHRTLWTLPDFSSYQHYFRVKDAYVSHGKLVVQTPFKSIPLTSLWDIRKAFPSRAGSFSGASEYTKVTSQELTVYQSGCVLDSCLIPADGIKGSSSVNTKDNTLRRPDLPPHYMREIPRHHTTHPFSSLLLIPTYADITCGYFLVERLGISIPTLLDLI